MTDKKKLHETLSKIESAVKQVRIIPAGADDPLPPVPETVVIDDGDLDEISRLWDETMPELAGMLDAQVINRREYDNAQQ